MHSEVKKDGFLLPQITTLCKIKPCQTLKSLYGCITYRFHYITTLYHIVNKKCMYLISECIVFKGFGGYKGY
jgi:hypothetical protein